MEVRFNPWHLAIAGTLLCVLLVGGLIWYRTFEDLTPAQFAALLPPGEGTVVYCDVKALREAGLIEKISPPGVSQDPEYLDFVRESGFDYRQDLDTVVVQFAKSDIHSVLRGHFDWSLLSSYSKSHNGSCQVTFCRMPASQKGRVVSFFPLFPRVMALSVTPSDWGAMAISRRNSPRDPPPVPPQAVWVSMSGTTLADSMPKLPPGTLQYAKALTSAERIVIGAGAAAGRYEIAMDATCLSPQDATVLRTQLDGLTDMLRRLISREKQMPNPADLSGVLTNGSFRQDGRHVLGHWPVERAFVDAVIGGS